MKVIRPLIWVHWKTQSVAICGGASSGVIPEIGVWGWNNGYFAEEVLSPRTKTPWWNHVLLWWKASFLVLLEDSSFPKVPSSHHHQNGGHYPKYLASGLYIFHWWQKLGIQTNQVWRSHNACWSILIWHDLMFRAREMRNLVCSSLKNCNLVTNFDSYVFRIRCTVAFSSRGEKIFDRRGKGYVSKMSLTPKTNLYIGLVQFLWMAAYKRW